MHSRSFLHRTADTPRASADTNGPEAQHPLGFADVRADGAPEAPARPRNPIGFAPAEPHFVTELSFRRTAATSVQPSQAPAPSPTEVPPPLPMTIAVGPASPWRNADTEVTAVADDTAAAPRSEERVPFYKREITLRRRKPDPQVGAVEHEEFQVQAAAEDASGAIESAADDPTHPIGFAAPADESELDVVEPEPVDEPEVEVPFVSAEAESEDELAQADEAEIEELDAVTDAEPAVMSFEDEQPEAVQPDDEQPEAVQVDEPFAEHEPETIELEEPVAEEPSSFDPFDADDDEPQAIADEPELEQLEPVAAADADEDLPVEERVEAEAQGELDASVADELHDDAAEHGEDLFDDGQDIAELPVAADDAKGKRSSIRARRGGTPKAPKAKSAAPRAPRSGGRKAVGLKIGASQLAAAVVSHGEGRDQLVQLAREPLEAGIVVDGEVRDAEALQDAIKSFFDAHKLPRRDVRIGVASNRIGVRTVDIAGIDEADRFDNAVRFKAHEVLPVSVSESVLDYRVVEERVTETGDVVKRVLLVVAPRDQVEPFARAVQGAGVKLSGIDLEALGLLRAFVEPQAPGSRLATDTATVVVAIGHESTTLLVAGGGACEFTRVFDWGGLALEQAISLELDISLGEAQSILHGLSLVGPGTTMLDEDGRVRALDAVRARLTPFARELVSSLQFYQAQSGSLGIGEIVITGGTSHLEGLADALHQMIGVYVRVGDPLARLTVPFAVDPEIERTIGSLAVPVGLAIEDDALRGVNLLPQELKGQRKKVNPLHVALPIAAVVPIAAMGFLFFQAGGTVSDRQDEIAAVQAQIDALPEPTRPSIDPALAVDQQARASALATVLGSRLQWDRVLGDVSRVLPRNVWLTHFTAKTPDLSAAALPAAATAAAPGVPPTPTGVTIEGFTYELTDVAVLISRLETVPTLSNVSLSTTEKKLLGKKKAISFTIVADLDQNGGAQ